MWKMLCRYIGQKQNTFIEVLLEASLEPLVQLHLIVIGLFGMNWTVIMGAHKLPKVQLKFFDLIMDVFVVVNVSNNHVWEA